MRTICVTLAVMMIAMVMISCSQEQTETSPMATTSPFFTTLDEARAVVATSGQNVLVDFYTDW